MSDAIQALNEVVFKCSERGGDEVNPEDLADHRLKLLELITEIAGDCLEDHVAAKFRLKPRKQRVYQQIVKEVSALVGDVDMTDPEANYYTIELIQELLNRYHIEEAK